MAYDVQFYPGESKIAENRRKHLNPDYELEILRSIADDDIVKLLSHRNPGEGYKTVHPPLDEMDFEADDMKDFVEPIDGAKKEFVLDTYNSQIPCITHQLNHTTEQDHT